MKMNVEKVRIVVFGAAKVGKTSIIKRFIDGEAPLGRHKPTVEDYHFFKFQSKNGDVFKLDILDTSGTFAFPAMNKLAIENGDMFFLVYSIMDPSSFEHVCRTRQEILSLRDPDSVRITVICNKTDGTLENVYNHARIVKEWGCDLIQASAQLNIGISDCFLRAIPRCVQREVLLASQCLGQHRRRGTIPAAFRVNNMQRVNGRKAKKQIVRNQCAIL